MPQFIKTVREVAAKSLDFKKELYDEHVKCMPISDPQWGSNSYSVKTVTTTKGINTSSIYDGAVTKNPFPEPPTRTDERIDQIAKKFGVEATDDPQGPALHGENGTYDLFDLVLAMAARFETVHLCPECGEANRIAPGDYLCEECRG